MRFKDMVRQLVFSFLGAALIVGMATGSTYGFLSSHYVPGQPMPVLSCLGFGLFCMVGMWIIGHSFASKVAATADLQIFFLAPLTPSHYFKRNVTRIAIALFMVFVVAPAAVVALYSRIKEFRNFTAAPFSANFILTYLLVFLVPLHEKMSGRFWSKAFFFFRTIVHNLLRLLGFWFDAIFGPTGMVGSAVLVLLFFAFAGALAYIIPHIGSPLEQSILEPLVSSGTAGLLVLYALVPFAGVLCFHQPGVPASAQWLLTAILSLLVIGCVRAIWKCSRVFPRELEEQVFAGWLEHREGIENGEETAYEADEQAKPKPPSSIECDGLFAEPDSHPPAERAAILEYDPTLSPERQILRHARYWREDLPPPFRWAWLSVVVVLWIIYLSAPELARVRPMNLMGVREALATAVMVGMLFAAFGPVEGLRMILSGLPTLPVRWPSLVWRSLRSRPDRIAGDVLAAILLTRVLGAPLALAVAWVAVCFMLRISLLAGMWLNCSEKAGRKWPLFWYYVAMIIALLVMILTNSIAVYDVISRAKNAVEGVICSACISCVCTGVVFLTAMVGIASQKESFGSQIVLPPPPLTSFVPERD